MNTLQKIGSFLGEKLSEVYTMLKVHVNDRRNPHGVTKEQVGLGNADNTSDLEKPVSTAQQEALDRKIDREEGKELVDSAEADKLANIGAYLSEATGFRAEADGSWSVGFRRMNPADGSSAVQHFTLPVVGDDHSGLMPPEYKQMIGSMGSGVIVIPADFTKGTTAMEAEMIAVVQERLADGTLFKKPVYLLYCWKDDYTSPDAPVNYSLVPRSAETRTKYGSSTRIQLQFNSSIVVADAENPEYPDAYCLVINVSGSRVTISFQGYKDEHPLEGIYLTEDENGLINMADKNWDKLYAELKKNNRPQVSLKTLSSGMYCPASYEFSLNDETAENPVYSGTLEISYVKETDGIRELWVETRVIPDFGVTGSYHLDSYLKKYPLNTGNKPLNIIAEHGERMVYDGSAELSVRIPRIGHSVQVRGLNEHGYWEAKMYDSFCLEMDLVGMPVEGIAVYLQKVYYEAGEWKIEYDYALDNVPDYSFPINMISVAEEGYYRWRVYYQDKQTLLTGVLESDIVFLHVVGKDKTIVPVNPLAFSEGYELYNPFMPEGEDNTAGAYFKLYGFTEAVTGKLMKNTDAGWVEVGAVTIEHPYVYEDLSVAGIYKIVLTDEDRETESGEFRVKERNPV